MKPAMISPLGRALARGRLSVALGLALLALPLGANAQVLGAEPAPVTAESAGAGRDIAGGRVFIDVHREERPLGAILDLLARVSGYSIVVKQDEIRNITVKSLRLGTIYWRDALKVIAQKYKLDVKDIGRRVIMLEKPTLVTYQFLDSPAKQIINAIAAQAGANVVLGESVTGTVSLSFTGVPWRDALESVVRTAGCVVVTEPRDVIRIAKPEELATQMETQVFQLAYLQAGGGRYRPSMKSDVIEKVQAQSSKRRMSLKDVLEKVMSEKGTVGQVEGTNSLVVTDTPQKLEVMGRIISELDKPPKQVHLSIKLIELSDSDAEDVGILWQNGLTAEVSGMSYPTMFPFSPGSRDNALAGTFPGSSGALIPKDGQAMALGSPLWVSEDPIGKISLGSLSFTKLTALLQFIRTQTKGRVIQSPQLIVLDHEEATIHVGELVRYAESFQSTTEGGGLATGFREASNSPVRLGIQVLVIPHVTGPDNNVILHIIPKTETPKSAILFETFEGGPLGQLKLPQTVQRTVVTKMMLRDRETGIIAGLRQQSFGETITKIPLLGDLPIIGWLFKHRSRPAETNKNTTLLILVTPTVIDFERKVDIGPQMKEAMEELGSGFSLEEEPPPQLTTPGAGGATVVR